MGTPKHFFSMTKAANFAGVNRSTIQRQIKAGKLSAERDDNKQWRIDPAELSRVYPDAGKKESVANDDAKQRQPNAPQHSATPESTEIIATLRTMVETLERNNRREVEHLNETIEDLRDRLDKEAAHSRALTAMLTDQREQKEETPEQKRVGFFGLFSASN